MKDHKENIARLQLNLLNLDNIDRELIEELCLPASVITDMPRSPSSQFSSKTENAVFQRDFFKEDAYDELMKQSKEICRVEAVLKTLSRQDMLIVELKYFEKCTWGLTAKLYAERLGYVYISKDTIKRQNKRILLKLQTLLGGDGK